MEGSLIEKRRESYCQTSLGNYVADRVSSFWAAPESKAQSHKQKLQRGKFQFIIWKIYIYILVTGSVPAMEQTESLSK